MAEQITQDVVKEAQSMGDASPFDATATTTIHSAGDGEALTTANTKPSNALPTPPPSTVDSGADAPPPTDKPGQDATTVGGGKDADIGSAQADGEQFAVPELPSSQRDPSPSKAEAPLVNGEAGDLSAEDATSQQALAEISGGSDTDISRPGSVDQSNERSGRHLRSNSSSIKKPASFKSVSVTKNFLAKAVSTPVARSGDKAPPAGQANASMLQTAKPRLVAKSGSGLSSVMRTSLAKTNGAGSGPDAAKVWNKNQPVPPPPPKQFTDEELKQQYGIHLATRLQADDTSKEAKWADIDDDEDDWAPETVEWMDGTKSTVNTTEAPPPEEPKPTFLRKETPEPVRPGPPPAAIQRPSSTSGNKTILKPGIKSNLVMKGAPEKPTLVAKPSAPAQVKSPWAALPPVEKVSPVQINPSHPPPPSRFSQRDPHGFDALPPVPSATRELAPDDFNRSWRDERGNKELFNSHNGRYEPVNEVRRGSIRGNEFRQPSVLQRPSPQGAPAEPSAAFQTSRSSGEAPNSWGRRRNSSNVSGGSGRRPSFAPDMPPIPLDMHHRRESHGSDATPGGTPRLAFAQRSHVVPEHAISPADQHSSWTQRSSPNISHPQPASPFGSIGSGPGDAVQSPAVPIEDAVATQKRLMQEKIERAKLEKKRQQEEEAKEEAARKERLRLKLEAMGIGESKSKPKEASPSRAAQRSPQKDKAVPAPMPSPPKPPVPQSEGEVAQYGMMKVHQPHPFRKPSHAGDASVPEPKAAPKGSEVLPPRAISPLKALGAAGGPGARTHPAADVPIQPTSPAPQMVNKEAVAAGDNSNNSSSQPPQLETSEARAQRPPYKPADRPPPTWTSTTSSSASHIANTQLSSTSHSQDSRTAWSSGLSKAPSSSSNVWGPPHQDRALGNGTFETSSFNRASLRSASQQQLLPESNTPGPIAPPSSSLRHSPAQPSAVPVHSQAFPPSNTFISTEKMGRNATTQAGRHGYRQQTVQPRPARALVPPPGAAGGWANFANVIQEADQKARNQIADANANFDPTTYKHDMQESFSTLAVPKASTEVRAETIQPKPEQVEVEKPIVKAEVLAVAEPIKVESVKVEPATPARNYGLHPAARAALRAEEAGKAKAAAEVTEPGAPTRTYGLHPAARYHQSRFFGGNASATSSQASQKSDSPPPPETQSHPVYDTEDGRPKVNLPVPKAVVKLPPPRSVPAPPVTMPVRAKPASGLGASPIVATEGWQARFKAEDAGKKRDWSVAIHDLIHGKAPTLAVASASKAPFDDAANVVSATVSLPITPTKRSFVEDDSQDVVSRVSAHDSLYEDREFGSLPVIKLPTVSHASAIMAPAQAPSNRLTPKAVDVTSKDVLVIGKEDENAKGTDIHVRVGNMTEAVNKSMPRHRNDRRTNGYQKRAQGPRPRNSSGNHQGQGGAAQATTPRMPGGGRMVGWGRQSGSQQGNPSYNKRATPGVVH